MCSSIFIFPAVSLTLVGRPQCFLHFLPCLHVALSCRTVSGTLAWLPVFEFRSVRRSFPGSLAESGEAASFLGRAASFETGVREREPWDFCEWIACGEGPRCAPSIFPMVFWREV